MIINTNLASLNASRQLLRSESGVDTSMTRLTSGKRINTAGDDAAGLSISNLMTSQIREKMQGIRNANDAVSLIQVADKTLETITGSIHRARELAVQAANGIYSEGNKQILQSEVTQLLSHIDDTNDRTTFNGLQIFVQDSLTTDKQAVLQGLENYWISEAEDLIETHFGLSGDASKITVNLDFTDGKGGTAASISWTKTTNPDGLALDLTLNIDMEDFSPANLPNGGTSPFYNDRIIAHEMVHAVMAVNMDLTANGSDLQVDSGPSLPGWFTEGAAEFIHGADERVSADISRVGVQGIIDAHQTDPGSPTTSEGYSAAYVAVKKLHADIQAASSGSAGIKDVMAHLSADPTNTLDSALTALKGSYSSLGYADLTGFDVDFNSNADDFINNAGSYSTNGLNLGNSDTGSIAGSDYGGGVLTAETVLANDASAGSAQNFALIAPTITSGSNITFVVGSLAADKIELSTSGVNTTNLGIGLIDIAKNASGSIEKLDSALEKINTLRGNFSSVESRLSYSINNMSKAAEMTSEARSRIEDADYAKESANLAKFQVLQQAAIAILAQANAAPQQVLSLLQ
jgi:flagellin